MGRQRAMTRENLLTLGAGIHADAFALQDTAFVAGARVRVDVGRIANGLGRRTANRSRAVGATAIGAAIEVRAAACEGAAAIVGIYEDRVAIASAVARRLGGEAAAGS